MRLAAGLDLDQLDPLPGGDVLDQYEAADLGAIILVLFRFRIERRPIIGLRAVLKGAEAGGYGLADRDDLRNVFRFALQVLLAVAVSDHVLCLDPDAGLCARIRRTPGAAMVLEFAVLIRPDG